MRSIDAKTALVVFALLLLINHSTAAGSDMKTENMQKTAREFISDFNEGKDFHPQSSVVALIRNGEIDKTSLSLLSYELRTGTRDKRENIVELLVHIGFELDSPDPTKTAVLRNKSIIKTLLTEGFTKQDSAKDLAEKAVRRNSTPSTLAGFKPLYLASLKNNSGDYLLIAAKAKTIEVKPYLDALSKNPDWRDNPTQVELLRIAKAALGDRAIEEEFVRSVYHAEKGAPSAPENRFYDVGSAKDGEEVAAGLYSLGLIGTQRTLAVACEFLRSPLKTYVQNAYEKSVRFSAVDAIRYNYPDELVLQHPESHADWQAVENFCVRRIRVKFDGPTPDLPPDNIYPLR